MSVTHKRAQMMNDMVIESTRKPTDHRVCRRVISRCREDVVDPIVKFVAAQGEVSAVDTVRCLEYEGHAQTDDQMGEQERQADQQRRFLQHHDWQDQHVGEVEGFPGKEDDIFPQRMRRVFQIIVGGKEEALKVSQKHIVEGKHRVKEQRIYVLEPLKGYPGFVGRKA